MRYYAAISKDEILCLVTTLVELEGIVLNQVNQKDRETERERENTQAEQMLCMQEVQV